MFRKISTIGLALGLLLPGSSVLAQSSQERTEQRVRTERQEMVQTGSPAAGEQVRSQERERTHQEKQTRDKTGKAGKQHKKKGSAPSAAGDRDKDKDQLRDHDRVREHQGSGTQSRSSGR